MNSKLGEYWFNLNGKKRGVGVDIGVKVFRHFPLFTKRNQTIENKLIELVDQLLQLNEEKAAAKLSSQVSQLESKIDYCENRVNELVYQLYELTPEEIKIVESA
jgi:uncharacterized protein Yka (UPF0111/DUF47 family)